MSKDLLKNRKTVHMLMVLAVIMWGFEYITAKYALEVIEPLTLTCYKYVVAAVILFLVRTIQRRKFPLQKKHIITLILCALFGQVLYFLAEYNAMDYLPVSMISIILAFVPLLSIILEIFIHKRNPNLFIVLGIITCIIGVAIIIGVDLDEIFSGRGIGYLLAISCVFCWNAYNYITERLTGIYAPYDLTFLQITTAVLLTLPYALFNPPAPGDIDLVVIGSVLFLGGVAGCLGFIIYVIAISAIGPTPCALYSNFLPVSTSVFGWIFLGERLTMLQIFGGVVVITSAAMVIWQKGRLDERLAIREKE